MKKYERMLQVNREMSRDKVACAKAAIIAMERKPERITVIELAKRTGLSRAFFYKNEEIREELRSAMGRQQGMRFTSPRKVILDAAMERQLSMKDMKIAKLEKQIKALNEENAKLQKALNRKDLAFLKKL